MRCWILASVLVLASCSSGSSGNNSTQPPPADTTPPVISLAGDDPLIIAVDEAYADPGATATDNRDGDLTASIAIDASAIDSSVPGEYTVTYNVTDAAGNSATTVTRTVIYEDRTPPTISLQGSDPQIIAFGANYTELGAAADDNVDGDVSASIAIDATSVNTAIPGEYTVTYDVSDAAGNAATAATRTVTVHPPVPAEVTLSVEGDIKTLDFSWDEVQYADYYRLLENPDGHSGFSQFGDDIPAGTMMASQDISVHLFDWENAQYMVEACNVTGCSTSDAITATDVMLDTIGYFKASNSGQADRFGREVALSGDGRTLAVASLGEDSCATGIDGDDDDACSGSGAVYLFRRDGEEWSQHAYLKASNADPVDEFGSSIALSADGNTLAVASVRESSCAMGVNGDQDNNACEFAGAAYVFHSDNNGWYQEAYIKASNTESNDFFARSLSLSPDGNTLAVGATGEDSNATGLNGDETDNSIDGAGAVYIFGRDSGTWMQQAYLKASNTGISDTFPEFGYIPPTDGFGALVDFDSSGNSLTVVARAGLYRFQLDGDIWQEAAVYVADNGLLAANDIRDVDTTDGGATIAVGLNSFRIGSVWVFRLEGDSFTRREITTPEPDPESGGDSFGTSVAFSPDGNSLYAGTLQDYWGDPGIVYKLDFDGLDWILQRRILASNPDEEDYFGWSLALSADGKTLAVGATQEASAATGIDGDQSDNSAAASGAVYVY